MMRSVRACAVASWLFVGSVGVGACRAPTQMTIEVTTRLRCSELSSGVVLAVGSTPEATEQKASLYPSATTHDCADDGFIGTLVVTPGTDAAAVVVTAGIGGRPTSDCTAAKGYKDCIVARRSFAFVEHTRLMLPIELTADCVNVPCGVLSTCSNGVCVSSHVDCTGDGCAPIAPGPPDAGPIIDATADAPVIPGDAADASDAADAAKDSGLPSDVACAVVGGGPMTARGSGNTAFCIDRTEVTQAAYASFLAKSLPKSAGCTKAALAPALDPAVDPPCEAIDYTPASTGDRPVTCVDHCDAETFCAAVGKRLCTLVEWQSACSSGLATNKYPYGGVFEPTACNGSARAVGHAVDVATLPECQTTAAPGVYDMSGNVWEWTEGGVRGGGFRAGDAELVCGAPGVTPGGAYTAEIGFRCCKTRVP